jgi:hypothetical protein
VGQAVYRLKEILDRYFSSDEGRRYSFSIGIELNHYRLRLVPKPPDDDAELNTPFLDSPFP